MTSRSRTRSALLALLVAFPALAAPAAKPAAKPAATPHATKRVKPKPGTLAMKALPVGGWLAQLAGSSEHVNLLVPGFAAASGRALLLTTATSDDYAELLASNVTILDAAGKTVRTESLPANRPYDGDLSPDGTFAAVLAHPFVTTGEQAFVFGMDDSGKKWRKPADPEARVLAGNTWVALTRPPAPAAAGHGAEDEAPTVRPAAVAVVFLSREGGAPMKPPQPIAGALARSANAVVSVGDGKLVVHDAKLAKRASADVPYAVAYPTISANGSVIAVADFAADAPSGDSGVLLFDGAAKPLGKFSMKAAVGVTTAIAPDGAAVLASPAWMPDSPVKSTPGGGDELVLALFDKTGKERWRYQAKRNTPDEAFVGLSVGIGGAWAAAGIVSSDEERPGKVFVFDSKGAVVYEADGELAGLWLDSTGQWLYTVEPGAVSRLKVSALRAGTSFPEEEDVDGEDIEAEIEAEDARENPTGTPESYPEDKAPK